MQIVTYAELEYTDLFAHSSGRLMDGGSPSEVAIPPAAFHAGASDVVACASSIVTSAERDIRPDHQSLRHRLTHFETPSAFAICRMIRQLCECARHQPLGTALIARCWCGHF